MKNRTQLWILGIIALLFSALISYFAVMYLVFAPYKSDIKPLIVDIPYGMSSKKIAGVLREKGIIRSKTCFLIYLKFTHTNTRLRAGSFLFSQPTSLHDVVENLVNENGAARLIRVTIPEGYTIWNIAKLLEEKRLVQYSVFVEYAHNRARNDLENEFSFLKESPVTTVEGYLFPDTYLFSPGATPKMIIRILLQTFEQKMIPLWQQPLAGLSSESKRLSFHQTLTLASLIEKEAANKAEMPIISSVFFNRINKKMKLASDPTVVYALGLSHKQKVLYRDLEVDSAYNTYKYKGVPLGPIASPGLASFHAALYPQKTDFLFFVADKKGGHIFTKTYKQHLNAQKVRLKNE